MTTKATIIISIILALTCHAVHACDPSDPPPSIFEFDGSKSKRWNPLSQLLSCDEWEKESDHLEIQCVSPHLNRNIHFYYGPMVYAGPSSKLFETVEFLIKVRGYHDHGLEERRGRKFVLDLLKCLDPAWDGSEVFVDQAIHHSLKTWKPQVVRRPEFFILIKQHHFVDLDGDFAWVDITTSEALVRKISRDENYTALDFYDLH